MHPLRRYLLALLPVAPAQTTRVPLTMVVGSSGHMRNDGKGPYVTGVDYVGVWLDPSRWPRMPFDFCMNWPFTIPPRPKRTVEHHLTDPVPNGGGKRIGVFPGPNGNDLVISRDSAVHKAFSHKRGPQPQRNPLAAENEKLRRHNQRLQEELEKAHIKIGRAHV